MPRYGDLNSDTMNDFLAVSGTAEAEQNAIY